MWGGARVLPCVWFVDSWVGCYSQNLQLNLGLCISFISVADKLDCSHGCKPTRLKCGQSSPKAGAEGRNDGSLLCLDAHLGSQKRLLTSMTARSIGPGGKVRRIRYFSEVLMHYHAMRHPMRDCGAKLFRWRPWWDGPEKVRDVDLRPCIRLTTLPLDFFIYVVLLQWDFRPSRRLQK